MFNGKITIFNGKITIFNRKITIVNGKTTIFNRNVSYVSLPEGSFARAAKRVQDRFAAGSRPTWLRLTNT